MNIFKFKYTCKTMLLITLYLLSPILSATSFSIPEQPGPGDFDYEMIDSFVDGSEEIIVSGFMAAPEFRSSNLQLSYYMKDTNSFSGRYLISNHTNKPVSYTLFSLIDYQQKNFTINKKLTSSFSLTLNKNERKVFNINFNDIQSGAHDFIFVAVRTDIQQFKEFDVKNARIPDYAILTHRANIYNGSDTFANTIKFPELDNTIENEGYYAQLVINQFKKIKNFGALKNSQWGNGSSQDYLFHVSNFTEKKLPYALVLFANNAQTSLSNHNQMVSYFSQNKQSIGIIPFQLTLKKAPKRLWALVIDNPYSKLEKSYGIYNDILSDIRISNTVLFNQ